MVLVAPEGLPIPPVRGGSVQIYLQALHRTLRNFPETADVTLICPGPEAVDEKEAEADPMPARKTAEESLPLSDRRIIHVGGRKAAYRNAVIEQLRTLRPDIIQVDNRPDFLPRVRQACPAARIVLNLHSTTFLGPRHLQPQQAIPTLRLADAIVVNSHYLRQRVTTKFGLQRANWPFTVIYPGVNVDAFAAPPDAGRDVSQAARPGTAGLAAKAPEQSRAEEARPLQLLFVGRVIEQKGVHVLVDALDILRKQGVPATLVMVGRAPAWQRRYEGQLRRKIRTLPVAWIGFVPPHELAPYYWDADLLVCPSQRDEAFGLVNLEAMAAGVPVVASRLGGIREVVTEDAGVLVAKYKRPAAFAQAIQSLHANPARMQQLREGARKRAQAFPWQRTAEGFRDLYQALVSGP
ncbi:glycosyltransferase family 4 protein [Alicyclobacillus cycloheptanicus]|uniref:glycosyltransferase family 4 protein n=1 Tax=Alicyclobacillus cycloheptanicus TaxID=1457 RepID=UPI002378D3F3|nr:glycosyltransferase family 4 protein [Alicyclobacillus cycloheptanicus]